MKKILIFCALALVVVLAGCGSEGSASSSSDLGTNTDGSVTKTLSSSTDATAVSLDGNDGDRLSLSIPALTPEIVFLDYLWSKLYLRYLSSSSKTRRWSSKTCALV